MLTKKKKCMNTRPSRLLFNLATLRKSTALYFNVLKNFLPVLQTKIGPYRHIKQFPKLPWLLHPSNLKKKNLSATSHDAPPLQICTVNQPFRNMPNRLKSGNWQKRCVYVNTSSQDQKPWWPCLVWCQDIYYCHLYINTLVSVYCVSCMVSDTERVTKKMWGHLR